MLNFELIIIKLTLKSSVGWGVSVHSHFKISAEVLSLGSGWNTQGYSQSAEATALLSWLCALGFCPLTKSDIQSTLEQIIIKHVSINS